MRNIAHRELLETLNAFVGRMEECNIRIEGTMTLSEAGCSRKHIVLVSSDETSVTLRIVPEERREFDDLCAQVGMLGFPENIVFFVDRLMVLQKTWLNDDIGTFVIRPRTPVPKPRTTISMPVNASRSWCPMRPRSVHRHT